MVTHTQTISISKRKDWPDSLTAGPTRKQRNAQKVAALPVVRPVQQSILLQIPTDVLLLVCDQLEKPSALSLALSCRDMQAVLYESARRRMVSADKTKFLQIIEGDPLTSGLYHCFPCATMHPFKGYWGPRSRQEISEAPKHHHCGQRDRFSPIGNPYELSFTHAHLAMNRHFYGENYGIPLENLCVEYTSTRNVVSVRCQTDAKIIDDELYLSRTYSFTVPKNQVAKFRRCIGTQDFRICEHTSFFQNSSAYRQYIPELSKRHWNEDGNNMVPCQDVPGSCGLCLMDYDITISHNPTAFMSEESYSVIIRTLHDLGACRAPDDWKWARFTEACRPHLFFPNRPNRRGSTAYPGTVKKRWVEACGGDGERVRRDIQEKQAKKHAAKLPFDLPAFTIGKACSKAGGNSVMVVKAEVLEV